MSRVLQSVNPCTRPSQIQWWNTWSNDIDALSSALNSCTCRVESIWLIWNDYCCKHEMCTCWLKVLRTDLRDPSTTPLNFTKSINLALSERGVNAMRYSGASGLLEEVMKQTIPMRARMIHGRNLTGELYEQSQQYDIENRVRLLCNCWNEWKKLTYCRAF